MANRGGVFSSARGTTIPHVHQDYLDNYLKNIGYKGLTTVDEFRHLTLTAGQDLLKVYQEII